MHFSIFTHVVHFRNEKKFYAYAPYVREMNIWLKYVKDVELVGPAKQPPKRERPHPYSYRDQRGSFTGIAYNHSNLRFTTIPSLNLLSFSAIIKAIVKIPIIFFRILRAMHRADHLHIRCPGNIGLIACSAQIFFPQKPKTAKYAGNWDPDAKQPWSYKLQKWILSNTFLTKNMKVLVYGEWPNQTKNILPFFTASFSESEIGKIKKDFSSPFKFLFVGNLVPGKQPLFALELVKALNEKNINAELHVYGDGEMMDELKNQTENNNYIHLHGNQSLEVLKQSYKDSHFLVLASKSEGWPKAVAEGMFFGCIPVVTSVSCVPWMINYGSRGILIPEVRVDRGQRSEERVEVESGNPPLRFGQGGKRKVDSQDGLNKVDTRPYGSGREVRGQRSEGSEHVIEETVQKIIELINDPEELRRMSMETQEWSQEYTLERFEAAIKDILKR